MYNSRKVIPFLISIGVDPNDRDWENRTPILVALKWKHSELAKELALIQVVDCSVKDNEGNSTIHYAVDIEDEVLMRTLALRTQSVNLQNKQGMTPLLLASYKDKLLLVKSLIDIGASPLLKAKSGETAFSIALRRKSFRVLDFLVSWSFLENPTVAFIFSSLAQSGLSPPEKSDVEKCLCFALEKRKFKRETLRNMLNLHFKGLSSEISSLILLFAIG